MKLKLPDISVDEREQLTIRILTWVASLVENNEEFQNYYAEPLWVLIEALDRGNLNEDPEMVAFLEHSWRARPIRTYIFSLYRTMLFSIPDLTYSEDMYVFNRALAMLSFRIDRMKLMPREEADHILRAFVQNAQE